MARCLEYWLWWLKVESMIMNRSRECVCECVGDVYDSGMFGVSEVLGEECGARVAEYPNFMLESADSPRSSEEGGTSLFTKYCVEDD
jgi:hypothetical protein